ncbi:MAG: succinate dehydrogenase assembly factor 2 [Chromatiales bacterium]|nr:MAG: succinate dehydrogenase assembly factor 2 [Chromatiales bacterium]
MRELDVLLMAYMDNEYPTASPALQRAFEQLLTMQDPDIQALLAGRLPAENAALHELVQRLLDHSDPAD